MSVYLNIIQILVSVALIALTAAQSRGSSASIFGGDSSIQHKRRGMEKTIFHLTIILVVIFFLTSVANVLVQA
ncbi:MAG: preprotein translocase subunit SecG [Chloroflexota bacterium]|nr:preprotein translocase subunit SecG [Chloroflexota bacterium]